ncbi:hypothetical protein EON80_13405 [bacterium]|nr:MAG: hypothetical protein EON80_13405 [bacterium]
MLLATIYWLIILLANAHFAQVARFSQEFGVMVQALAVICPSKARRLIVAQRLRNTFNRRFRSRRDMRRLGRARARLNASRAQYQSPTAVSHF